ncbi:TVP38/TMEM64 family protein [Nocardiopsis potens]|uniref:TVP38/TMEM64 family protein n=1 Tax=Nocardiopsis potens TaxID=1246458 RepID=UPI001F4CC6D8|nr:VTT domain-containing protein [Nocardiopsis potens]
MRAAVLAAAVAAAVAAGFHAPGPGEVRAWIEAAGPAAPAAYLVCYVAAALVYVPRPALNAAAGVLFSPWLGVPLALAGGVAAALAQFWLSRFLARDFVAARLPRGAAERLDRLTERHGLLAVVQLRLLPVLPFSAVNHGLGLTSLGAVPFTVGTALGGLPATLALVLLGDAAADPLSPAFLACAALFALLCAAGPALHRWRRRSARPGTAPPIAGPPPEDPAEEPDAAATGPRSTTGHRDAAPRPGR